MLNSKSFLAVDFGAGSLKLAEFEVNESAGLRLKHYSIKSLGADGAQETTREAVILKALSAIIAEKGIKSKNVNVCAPGFHVFSKFVKLPPVESSKVTQIIQYEAQQNVPFPLAEVVWDYQILGSAPGGELEVLLVAIKADIVEGLFRVTESAGLHLELADVSPAALCNAFRYNYGELEDCTVLLDIGAKTSNLLFFEKGKMFSRSINLGANSITQDFANESKLKFDAAEKTKIEEGFVSLGGAYEEPENPHQAAISKIARQFMTRLHIQVNQTMQFYRGQQGGSAPQRLFLSGGASIMPYTAQFFAEKLNVPVEYFNPLRNVQIDPSINLEELARVAHSLGEVIGLGLRNLAHCPVELNLMPDSTLKWQSFNQKKPYFIATVFSLVLAVVAMGFLFDKLAGVKNDALTNIHPEVEQQQRKSEQFKKVYHGDLKKTQDEANQVVGWMDNRYYWADILTELRQALIRSEEAMSGKLRTPAGVWIEQFTTTTNSPDAIDPNLANPQAAVTPPGMSGPSSAESAAFRKRYGLEPAAAPAAPPPEAASAPPPAEGGAPTPRGPRKPKGDTNEIATISITFRAVSLIAVSGQPEANKATAFQVLSEIQKSPLFDPDPQETKFSCELSNDEPPGTFTFCVSARLKNPLKL
jgi:type IV pilus assembly protein PilM